MKKFILCSILLAGGCVNDPPVHEEMMELPPSEDFDAHYGTWSPDGTKILFQHSDLSGDILRPQMLWVADLETGDRYPVFGGPALNPDWSPDGEWISFHSNGIPASIFTFNLAKQELFQLTGSGSPNDSIRLRHTFQARWSPDNNKILFSTGSNDHNRGVTLMNPDGTEFDIIIQYAVGANWFPDGEHIVYANWDTTKQTGDQRQLYMAKADGSDPEKLTDLSVSDFVGNAAASPDGKQVAFVHRPHPGNLDLYLLDLQTRNVERLTRLSEPAVRPEWHPDGNKILFSVSIPNVSRRLYLININTREIKAVFPEL